MNALLWGAGLGGGAVLLIAALLLKLENARLKTRALKKEVQGYEKYRKVHRAYADLDRAELLKRLRGDKTN